MNEHRESDEQGIQDIDYRCKSDEFCYFCVHRINQELLYTFTKKNSKKIIGIF